MSVLKMNGNQHTNIKHLKRLLRAEIRGKITQMDPFIKMNKSQLISEKVFQHAKYKSANRIGIYLHIEDEVQTHFILKDIFNNSKICFIPRYDESKMDMYRIHSEQELLTFHKTNMDILQPDEEEKRENALDNGGLDLLFVPGRAFTKLGVRLGRGKGCYDIYLKKYRYMYSSVLPYTIGLAFSEQIVPELPTNEHDEKVDMVIFS